MKTLILAVTLVTPAMGHATGMHKCEHVEKEDWLTETQLIERISTDGWRVNRVKQDGGCWEVYGNMPDGKRVEAYFHPATGEVQLINQRGTILFRTDE